MNDEKARPDDYLDKGPMPNYDNPNKPLCFKCESYTFVIAVGRDSKWNWKCTNCQQELNG